MCKLNTYYRPIKLSVGNNYADYSDKVVMKIVSFSLEKDNFLRKSHFLWRWLFYYVVLAELVLHLIANQRSSFIRCIGSSPIYYAHAVCQIGRGCCLENSLDVKVFGVRIPNTAYAPIFWQE